MRFRVVSCGTVFSMRLWSVRGKVFSKYFELLSSGCESRNNPEMKGLGYGFVLVILLISTVQATLDSLDAFDFSNLDLSEFKFFRNLPSQNPATAPYANPFIEHFQKKKAVLEYLDRLLLGNSLLGPPVTIEFHPNYGKAWRPYFEHHYGRRAERLIDLLGSGASVAKLKYHGVLPQDFGSYH